MLQSEITAELNTHEILTTQDDGEHAALTGHPRTECPYPLPSVDDSPRNQALRESWMAGYYAGQTSRRRAIAENLGLPPADVEAQ